MTNEQSTGNDFLIMIHMYTNSEYIFMYAAQRRACKKPPINHHLLIIIIIILPRQSNNLLPPISVYQLAFSATIGRSSIKMQFANFQLCRDAVPLLYCYILCRSKTKIDDQFFFALDRLISTQYGHQI